MDIKKSVLPFCQCPHLLGKDRLEAVAEDIDAIIRTVTERMFAQ
jgi:hypothetical protein